MAPPSDIEHHRSFPAAVPLADRKFVMGHRLDVVGRLGRRNPGPRSKPTVAKLIDAEVDIGLILRGGAVKEFRQPVDQQGLAVGRLDLDDIRPLRPHILNIGAEHIAHHSLRSIAAPEWPPMRAASRRPDVQEDRTWLNDPHGQTTTIACSRLHLPCYPFRPVPLRTIRSAMRQPHRAPRGRRKDYLLDAARRAATSCPPAK